MRLPNLAAIVLPLSATCALAVDARSQTILVLNGTGVSAIEPDLTAAGFTVISGTLDPGQIAGHLAAAPEIEQIWIWSDYTYGNGGIPADPTRDFDLNDLTALNSFSAARPHWICDGLAWRMHGTPDEISLTLNEALALSAAGGGILLGADDASGDSVVQHPNQVCAYFNFQPFEGVFSTHSSTHEMVPGPFSGPFLVDPTQIFSTSTYTQVPYGLQPNGLNLSTAIFAAPSYENPGYPNPPLATEVFNGVLRTDVNILITTTLPGGSLGDFAPVCSGDGTGSACPCGNNGLPGYGCDNSLGTGGGLLSAIGTPNVTLDDFTLQGSNMPPTATTLYFQGTVAVNTQAGVPFGDGLRCVGGSVIRLGSRTNSGGASGYGAQLGDTPISLYGAIPAAGGTWYYQAWYRNAASFCTDSTFNLTNALAVTWRP